MLNLSSDERRSLRARAHGLNPVVSIAESGLTEGVLREIDVNLKAHELIKIRVFNDIRDEREAFLATICEQLQAAPVQHIGKLLVVWRPLLAASAATKAAASKRAPRKPAGPKTKRSFQR